jgi:hypothetical protein
LFRNSRFVASSRSQDRAFWVELQRRPAALGRPHGADSVFQGTRGERTLAPGPSRDWGDDDESVTICRLYCGVRIADGVGICCRSMSGRALRHCAATRCRSASSSATRRRISRPLRQQRSASAWIRPSSAAAKTANATWRSVSATSRPPMADDRCLAPPRRLTPTSRRCSAETFKALAAPPTLR